MNKLRIRSVIFCEDIRAEMNGKYTLLGASSSELTITAKPALNIPAVISVALFVIGEPSSKGPFSVEIRVLNPDKKKIIGGNLTGEFKTDVTTSIVVGPMPVQIEKSGNYSFDWKFGDGKWEKIEKLNVTLNNSEAAINPAPNASPPLS